MTHKWANSPLTNQPTLLTGGLRTTINHQPSDQTIPKRLSSLPRVLLGASDPAVRGRIRHGVASVAEVEAQGQGREEGRRRRRGRHRGGDHGAAREGVDHVDDEEGQGGGALRLHPARHRHRHELRAQALRLPAPLPRLMGWISPDKARTDAVGPSASIVVCSWYFSCFDMCHAFWASLKKVAHAFWASLKSFYMTMV